MAGHCGKIIQSLNRAQEKEHPFVGDETCLKLRGERVYIWAAIDTVTKELLAIKATFRCDEEATWSFITEVLKKCKGKVCFLEDKGPFV